MLLTPDLDLTKTHWRRPFGDVIAFGSWFGAKERAPCLVLVHASKYGKEDAVPCVVMLSDAWAWDEKVGDGRYCARMSIRFADALGLNIADRRVPLRLTSIIRECLGDLLATPPKPYEDTRVVADAILTDLNSGKQVHREIVEHG